MAHGVPGGGGSPRIFAQPVTTASTLPDGSMLLRSGIPLEPYPASMAETFRAAAAAHPDRVLVAQRAAAEGPAGWRTVTYADAGVSIHAGEQAVEMLKTKVHRTWRPEVVGDLGGFAGLFRLDIPK